MDLHEGTSHLLRGDGGILHMKLPGEENFKPVLEIHGPVRFRPDALQNVNVFCMFALRESASDTFVDPRTCDFGDTFALLIDFDKFMKRVNAAMPSTGQELQSDLVDYIDETSYLGPVGIFKKASRFSYQSEFRIALLPGTGAPFRLHVGNLSDIVIVGRLSQLNERLQVKVNAEGRRTLLISADSEGCRSAFRTDVDHDSEVMPISVPN
ncbi:MAG: hypothetical protein ABSF62_17165 [Bryobacteraceae bacterium]